VADRNAQKDEHLAQLMRAANRGDQDAYRRVLGGLAPLLRGVARRGFARYGAGAEEIEDIVQETLLALHLKRHTWDERQPLLPWVRAIARNKLIDNLRRRGRQQEVPIDELTPAVALDAEPAASAGLDAGRMLERLNTRQRDIVRAVSIEGASAAEVGRRLGMTEGAVRVALHRALKSLATAFRDGARRASQEGPPREPPGEPPGERHEN
jgi:RNA polymerase sigma-70 factor (ECF subfamily)